MILRLFVFVEVCDSCSGLIYNCIRYNKKKCSVRITDCNTDEISLSFELLKCSCDFLDLSVSLTYFFVSC